MQSEPGVICETVSETSSSRSNHMENHNSQLNQISHLSHFGNLNQVEQPSEIELLEFLKSANAKINQNVKGPVCVITCNNDKNCFEQELLMKSFIVCSNSNSYLTMVSNNMLLLENQYYRASSSFFILHEHSPKWNSIVLKNLKNLIIYIGKSG